MKPVLSQNLVMLKFQFKPKFKIKLATKTKVWNQILVSNQT